MHQISLNDIFSKLIFTMRRNKSNIIIVILLLIVISISYFINFRFDLTSDKRFSISQQTKDFLVKVDDEINITVYLEGDLNPGFLRLNKAISEILNEMSVYSKHAINIKFENPSKANTEIERQKKYAELQLSGIEPTMIYERDKEGKSIQKIVYPWISANYKNKTINIKLLKNIRGVSGEENLNISIENLEFEITDGLRRLTNSSISKIAFIEGHGELNDAETYDISKGLSRYFQIDRGVLANDATILNAYKAIIIAKPTSPFSESDKYIIDQYIMHGGSVIWLIDGVKIDKENLSKTGLTPAMSLDLNLTDQLFRYGVRINPDILLDVQCTSIPINIAPKGTEAQFEPSPWFYAPLLLTSMKHPISKNITEIKADFCSSIEFLDENKRLNATLLLATSDNTHIITTPTTIDLAQTPKTTDKEYFNMQYLPVAVLVEGEFKSNFENRLKPKEITNSLAFLAKSTKTRQIFIADGDIIKNETNGIASDSTTLPLGFDRYMNQQFGNKEFIQNAVLYLTDEEGWLNLRSRTLQLRMLNKKAIIEDKLFWQILNFTLPLVLLMLLGIVYQNIRKRKYTK